MHPGFLSVIRTQARRLYLYRQLRRWLAVGTTTQVLAYWDWNQLPTGNRKQNFETHYRSVQGK